MRPVGARRQLLRPTRSRLDHGVQPQMSGYDQAKTRGAGGGAGRIQGARRAAFLAYDADGEPVAAAWWSMPTASSSTSTSSPTEHMRGARAMAGR